MTKAIIYPIILLMSEFESYGNGISGRVDGPLFDARHILMPASMALTTMGEAVQTEAEAYATHGIPLPEQSSLVGNMLQTVATMPMDAKAFRIGMRYFSSSYALPCWENLSGYYC